MSRDKGARGEREAAGELKRIFGCKAHRGRQYSGSPDSPDVKHSISGVHFEVKRTEKLSLYKAMEQCKEDCGNDIPVVLHRKNHHKWVAIVELDDLPQLAAALGDELGFHSCQLDGEQCE